MTMKMPQLPENLVEEEILCRVPATSLKRLRSTCKRWNGLFDDRRFARNHFEKAAKQHMVLMLTNEFKINSLNVDLRGIPSAEFKGELSLLDSRSSNSAESYISKVFHCDGLLVCTIKEETVVVVWNPCTGQTKWIQPPHPYMEFETYTPGSYQDKNSGNNSYKILRHGGYGGNERFEIFEINCNTWRTLDVPPDCELIYTHSSVSLKGKSYWFAWDRKDIHDVFLVSFDYTIERFERLCFPFQCNLPDDVALCLTREEKLAVLRRGTKTSKIEISVRNENDETKVVSWSKILEVEVDNPRVAICTNISFLVDMEKKVALCYESWMLRKDVDEFKVYLVGEDCKATLVDSVASQMRGCWTSVFNYVPSLVQIK